MTLGKHYECRYSRLKVIFANEVSLLGCCGGGRLGESRKGEIETKKNVSILNCSLSLVSLVPTTIYT